MDCVACKRKPDQTEVMKCNGCKSCYHYSCLNITKAAFREGNVKMRRNFQCDSCMNVTRRVVVTDDTPIRGAKTKQQDSTADSMMHVMDQMSPEKTSTYLECGLDTQCKEERSKEILSELRELRLELSTKLDEQAKAYKTLESNLQNIQMEMIDMKKNMAVLQEKSSKLETIEGLIKSLIVNNDKNPCSLNTTVPNHSSKSNNNEHPKVSFANITKQNQQVGIAQSLSPKVGVATKPASALSQTEPDKTKSDRTLIEVQEANNDWTVVNRKKPRALNLTPRYQNTDVKKGGSTTSVEIQGTERKKHLHVWRLNKETSEESMEKFVKSICGENVQVKVNKIKHKIERSYASFIIGVPESMYDKLSESENWPINVEYCEWVWFRKTTNTASASQ